MQFGTNFSINWYGFNVQTKKFVFNVTDAYNLQYTHWDPATNLIRGLGYTQNSEVALVTLNSQDGKMNVTGKYFFLNISDASLAILQEYQNIGGSASAFDWYSGILYSFMQTALSSSPFYLVGVDVTNGTVVSKPQACSKSYECPTCLEIFNKPWN
jgi:hypothetical protein